MICKNAALFLLTLLLLQSCQSQYSSSATEKCESGSVPRDEFFYTALGIPEEKLKASTGAVSLEDGGKSLITRAWLCDNAVKSLDIQYYIFSRDNTGLIASDFLVRAAKRGVRIRLIIDDVTAHANISEIRLLNSHDNIRIKVYNPGVKIGKPLIKLRKMIEKGTDLHRRMHIKTLIVDDLAAITGGRNIADEYFDYSKQYNFRDRDVMLLGKDVFAVKKQFMTYWNDSLSVDLGDLVNTEKKKLKDPQRFDRLHSYACDPENFSPTMRQSIAQYPEEFKKISGEGKVHWFQNVSFVADPPGKNRDRPEKTGGPTTDTIVALIKKAKHSIDIQSPYLIFTPEGEELFKEVTSRGVRVRILTNSLASTDNFEAFSGYQRDREAVFNTGVEVYEFKPDAAVRYTIMTPEVQSAISYSAVLGLHSKTLIIDGYITVIGSYNLDPRSANLNTECLVIVRSNMFAADVGKYIEEEFSPENSWRVTRDFNPDKEAGVEKRVRMEPKKVLPKRIL